MALDVKLETLPEDLQQHLLFNLFFRTKSHPNCLDAAIIDGGGVG